MKGLPVVIEDVGTTERKPLSKKQRLALFERKKGICCVCGAKINGLFIDEHWRALGLGGSNDASNRDIAHPACASLKTNGKDGDNAKTAKAKRGKLNHLRIKDPQKTGLEGRDQVEKRAAKAQKTAESGKRQLPPRPLFRDIPPPTTAQLPAPEPKLLPAPTKPRKAKP